MTTASEKAQADYLNYKKSEEDKNRSTGSEIMNAGDLVDFLPDDIFGGDDTEKKNKLLEQWRMSLAQEQLDTAKGTAAENKQNTQAAYDSIFGKGKSSTGFVDQYGNEVNVKDVNEARARVAAAKAGNSPSDKRPGNVPANAVREQASDGKWYWREPGHQGKEGGWITDGRETDLPGDRDKGRGEWVEAKEGDEKPAGMPDNAYIDTASNGRKYWRTPGTQNGKEGGWVTDKVLTDQAGEDDANGNWYETQDPGEIAAASKRDEYLAGLDYQRQAEGDVDNGIRDTYDDIGENESGYVKNFLDQLNGIKDPEVANYVGAFNSDKAGQNEALKRLDPLTSIQETAEERLIREMARRDMEGQMKGNREAMAQNLKQRGVYGSGAELAGQLASQQETASRRSLEEMGAQKNAQTRAMDALGKYSDLQTQMRGQDSVEGMFNKQTQAQHDQFKTAAQQEANRDRAARAGAGLNAQQTETANKTGRANNLINTELTLTGLKNGTNTAGANMVNGATTAFDGTLGRKSAELLANAPSGGMINLDLSGKPKDDSVF